jgi:hypothetical protein
MYSMACFLGLLSTLLLVLIVKQTARRRTYEILYVVFTVAGLATHVYVWPLFATQALWVFAANLRARSLPGLLRLQILTFVVATPLVAIAVYQSTIPAPTTLIPLGGVVRFLEFGSLFETDPLAISMPSVDVVASILALLSTALLISSTVLKQKAGEPTDLQSTGGIQECQSPRLAVTAVIAIFMALSILLFAYVAKTLLPGKSIRPVIAASLLPFTLFFIDVFLCNYWERFKGLRTTLAKKGPWLGSLRSLNFFLAVLPVSIVAATSFFKSIFVERGALVFVPFLVIVLASGLANLMRRDSRWVAIALILLIIHGFSVLRFQSKPSNPDYKALAEHWASQIEDSDLIFVHGRGHKHDWLVAPIFYYLNARRYHFVGRDFAAEIQNHPLSRVWVLSFPRVPTEKEAVDALASYELRKRVDALNIFAQLYVSKMPGDKIGAQRS